MTDWGRSERVETIVDRTVYDFLYHYWFRVEVEGIENIPDDGAALLVANHAGAIPSDGAMIAKAIREEHRRRRPVHLGTDSHFGGFPGLGMLVTKLGGVAAHPANLHRLLFDEGQLVLVFPEGRDGTRKPIKDRYRLRSFDSIPFVETAMRARAPILPVALLGAEEALPMFASIRPLRRLAHLPLTTGRAAAGEVQDPLPGARADPGARRISVARPRSGGRAPPRCPSTDPGEPPRACRLAAERVARLALAAAEVHRTLPDG